MASAGAGRAAAATRSPLGDDRLAFGSKLKHAVVEAIEELKVKRRLLLESEKHIKLLLSEKCDLQAQKDDLSKRLAKLEEKKADVPLTSAAIAAAEDKVKAQATEIEIYKAELASTSKELSALKDEVKRLKMDEHKWKMSEREMQLKVDRCTAGKEECESRLAALDALAKTLREEFQRLRCTQQKLDEDVAEAIKQNVSSKEATSHHQGIADHYEQLCSELKRELVEARTRLAMKTCATATPVLSKSTDEGEISRLKQQISALQERLTEAEDAHKRTLEMLTRTTKMLLKSSLPTDDKSTVSLLEFSQSDTKCTEKI